MAYTCQTRAPSISLLFLCLISYISFSSCLTFSDPDTAYAQYLPQWTPDGRQSVSFRFKSVSRDALLLLHHFTNKSSGDPVYNFWIELKGAKLQATHVYETYVETVTIGEGLDNDQWNTVDYNKDEGSLTLTLNGKDKMIKLNAYKYGLAKEKLGTLTHGSVVTLGGLSPSSLEMAPREFTRLLGCIDKVRFFTENGALQEIPVASTAGTKDGCINPCFTDNPCQQGQCINQYYRAVCDCFDTGYEGQYCHTKGNMELTFQGHNYIQYQFNKIGQSVSRDKLRITFQFKVGDEHINGVMFYASGSIPVQTYVAVYMENGRINIKTSLGSGDPVVMTSNKDLNDNMWHKIFIRKDGQFLLMLIDDQSKSHQISGENTQLHLDADVYVGGGPNLNGKEGLGVNPNYVGCMKEAYVDTENLIGAVKENTSMVTYNGGTPMFECIELGHTPLTFPNKRSQIMLNQWTDGELNLKFTFRTSFPDAVLIHALIEVDNTPDGSLNVRLVNGTMELQIDLGATGGSNRKKSVKVGTSLHNTAWHNLHLQIRTGNILLTVDGRLVGIPHKHTLVSRSAVYLGSDVSGENTGFEGCLRQIRMQGTAIVPTEIINSDMVYGIKLDGCQIALNPCASGDLVCENGGACAHESNGTTCVCEGNEFTGSRCQFPIYKKSCADYFRSGDFESGPKMIDIDGSGPLPAAYVVCDFSTGRPKTTIEHNFKPKTLIREYDGPSLQFNITYRDMSPEILESVVDHSSQCRQLLSHWCFESPFRLGKTSLLFGPWGRQIEEFPENFAKQDCKKNKQKWMQDIGYLNDQNNLPVSNMRILSKKLTDFSRATLTLGPLECFESVAADKPNTVTFMTPESQLILNAWRKSTLSFVFRTSTTGTVVFHQTPGQENQNYIMGYIEDENVFGFEVYTNGQKHTLSIETTRKLIDGQWHLLSIEINAPDMLFQVDNAYEVLSIPVGEEFGPFGGKLKLGGTDTDMLPEGKEGFTGCISAVSNNGKNPFLYDLYNEFKQDDIQPGCVSKCASKPCQNGALCIDKWTSYECVCSHPAHRGENCEIDGTKDVVSFSEPAVHLDYTPPTADILKSDIHLSFRTYQSDALVFYAHDHLHNFVQLELMDSAMLVFKYNSGRQIVEVVIDSRDVLGDDEMGNSTDTMTTRDADSFLNDGAWVDVSVIREDDSTMLKVNGDLMEEAMEPMQLMTEYYDDPFEGAEVTVKQPQVFVASGKADNFTLVLIGGAPDMMTSLTGLLGCVSGFMIGTEPLALKPLATKTMKGVSTQCVDSCSQGACNNNGECTEMWSSFRCNCTMTSYSGRLCTKDIGANFQKASLLIYPFAISEEEPAERTSMDSLSFGFSTETATGVLAYIRSDDDEQQSMDKSIIVKLTDGNVDASLDFGNGPTTISIEGTYNDGYRHVVTLRRFGNRLMFDVDNQDSNFTTITDSNPVLFTKRGALVAGGVEYNMTRFGLEGEGGYEGCIAGLNYNGIKPIQLLFGDFASTDNSGGVSKAQCSAFKVEPTSTPTGEDGAGSVNGGSRPSVGSSNSRNSLAEIPWDIKPAEGQVYVEPEKQQDLISPDLIKLLIIVVCGVAILILLICIIFMACKLMKKQNKDEKAATKEERQPLRRKDLEMVDAAPTRKRTLESAPTSVVNNSYKPVPKEDPQPPPQPKLQPQPLQQQPPPPQQIQIEPQVVATGHFTVESSPELKDEPPIPMIDDDVDDDEITEATPLTSIKEETPPPVPTSSPPELTPPRARKAIPEQEEIPKLESPPPQKETPSEAAPQQKEAPTEAVAAAEPPKDDPKQHKALIKTDSVLSDAETAV